MLLLFEVQMLNLICGAVCNVRHRFQRDNYTPISDNIKTQLNISLQCNIDPGIHVAAT